MKKISIKMPKGLRHATKISLVVFLVSVGALGVAIGAYHFDYRQKTLLNVYLSGRNLSARSPQDLGGYLDDLEKSAKDSKITLVKDDKKWEMSFTDLGWQIDKQKTQDRVFGFGHSQNIVSNIWPSIKSVFSKTDFDPVYQFDETSVQNWLDSIDAEIGTPKKEANIKIKDDDIVVVEPASGNSINEFDIKNTIIKEFVLRENGPIKVDLSTDNPIITLAEAQELKGKAKDLVKNDVELVGPKGSATLTKTALGLDIELKKQAKKKSFLSRQTEYGPAYVSFDNDKIKNFLQDNIESLNDTPVDAEFTIQNGKVSILQSSKDGRVIKLDDSVNLVVSQLEKGGADKINLPYQDQAASISAKQASDISKYGLTELIGTATTSFVKSPQNRIANITTGVRAISGALIKPGDEFSTLGRLGNIDASNGYLPELVIKENSTVPDFGGGLCQVSTTLFRSAMNAGLKITARQNHSYRVSYYEPPVGMDATIYSPAPDFKFLNDTPNYILVEGHVDGMKVTFDLYGTKDGRTVNITDPVVYDITDPPDPVYIDDPTLAPGETKQTDHAHPGAKATFTYTVFRAGQAINKQTFNSAYTPWPAKYLRGPDTAPAEESTPSPNTPTPQASQTKG